MEVFVFWISVIGAICLGVMALAIFFTLVNAIQRRFTKAPLVKVKGFFKNSEWLVLHLNGSKSIADVKLLGFSDDASSGKGWPYYFNNMAIFEHRDGRRLLIRGDTIRMIEELSANASSVNEAEGAQEPDA